MENLKVLKYSTKKLQSELAHKQKIYCGHTTWYSTVETGVPILVVYC
jgi:hypothetical protein